MDNDSETVLADDEGSDIGIVNIDSTDSSSVARISDNSSDNTESSLYVPSIEPSNTKETDNQKQDMFQDPDFSQQHNNLKEEAEAFESSDTETLRKKMYVNEENIVDTALPSSSKKRKLEDYPKEKPSHPVYAESEMAASSEGTFKKLKASDDSENISGEPILVSSHAVSKPEGVEIEVKEKPALPDVMDEDSSSEEKSSSSSSDEKSSSSSSDEKSSSSSSEEKSSSSDEKSSSSEKKSSSSSEEKSSSSEEKSSSSTSVLTHPSSTTNSDSSESNDSEYEKCLEYKIALIQSMYPVEKKEDFKDVD